MNVDNSKSTKKLPTTCLQMSGSSHRSYPKRTNNHALTTIIYIKKKNNNNSSLRNWIRDEFPKWIFIEKREKERGLIKDRNS